MPETTVPDLTAAKARSEVDKEVKAGATKVTLERQKDGNWTLKSVKP
jgi:hypothetical protein